MHSHPLPLFGAKSSNGGDGADNFIRPLTLIAVQLDYVIRAWPGGFLAPKNMNRVDMNGRV